MAIVGVAAAACFLLLQQQSLARPFDPAAVPICCPFMSRCGSLCGFGCPQDKGRRQKGGAGSWWASFRAHRDRDFGGQDADGGGAEQHRLDLVTYLSDGGPVRHYKQKENFYNMSCICSTADICPCLTAKKWLLTNPKNGHKTAQSFTTNWRIAQHRTTTS